MDRTKVINWDGSWKFKEGDLVELLPQCSLLDDPELTKGSIWVILSPDYFWKEVEEAYYIYLSPLSINYKEIKEKLGPKEVVARAKYLRLWKSSKKVYGELESEI